MAMDEKFRRQLEESGADVEATLKRFVGNDAIYQKFLGKFPNDPNYANLGANIESGNYEEAYKCAHALKGVVGNLGLTPIFENVSTLVEELRNKANADVDAARAAEEWQQVKTEYEKFIAIINENIPQ
ncbi:MAG: Hpt domain-containing protein [Lachnospiraceae bacterium]|nr:Hpt domain-containing protein [Lachnospiraceae bacterium]